MEAKNILICMVKYALKTKSSPSAKIVIEAKVIEK